MKTSMLVMSAFLGLVLNGVVANAADNSAPISDSVLAQMGMAGMQTVSDEVGMQIRGKGFTVNVTTINNISVRTNTNITVANFGRSVNIAVNANPTIRTGSTSVGISGDRGRGHRH